MAKTSASHGKRRRRHKSNIARAKKQEPLHIYHYTSMTGLQGILTSNVLFLSNIQYLNDREELRFVDNFIRNEMLNEATIIFSAFQSQGIFNRPVDVNMLAETDVNMYIDQIHRTSMDLAPIFVASFCRGQSNSDNDDGLLSQWRGYGTDGGVALRFDVTALAKLLRFENRYFDFASVSFGDVVYGSKDIEFPEMKRYLGDFRKVIPTFVEEMMAKIGPAIKIDRPKIPIEGLWKPYAHVAPRLKHPGFAEEMEYRIAISVWNSEKDPTDMRMKKPIKFAKRDNYLLPYVELNALNTMKLPVDRVLVGPSREMQRRFDSIRSFVRDVRPELEVVASRIPFA